MLHPATKALLLLLLQQLCTAYIQNAVCSQCAGMNNGYGSGSYGALTGVDSNPLSYFNGPTDFGNKLGQAIATRINEAYPMESSGSGRVTFGSYPMSTSYGTQNLGGSSYVVQPDLLQQSLSGYSGYGTQGLSSSLPSTFTSFPGYSGYVGQQTILPSSGYSFGNFNNLGGSTYGNMGATTFNSLGNYGSYGIPDPITTSGSTGGGCPYCFGNKGGYKAKRATFSKRIPSQLKKSSSESKKSLQAKKN